MRGNYPIDDSWGPETMHHCCGVPEIGDWQPNNLNSFCYPEQDYPKIKDFKSYGCGIFVSTFLPSQSKAMLECERHHTLLSKTGPHKNTSGSATQEGREKGVYLCVFKFGKEGK